MTTEIKQCTVKLDYESDYKTDETKYSLILELPLPGGKAVYIFSICKDQYDNVTKASTLTK